MKSIARKIIEKIKEFHNDEKGDIVQTGIITGILAVIAVGALVFLKPKIETMFSNGGSALDTGGSQTSGLE